MKKRPSARREERTRTEYLWAIVRIALGLIFLWAFCDKLLGLGYATCRTDEGGVDYFCDKAWIQGGSPTKGFLTYAIKGPFVTYFGALAGQPWVDWVFMIGLLGIGLALTLGILVHLASLTGSLLLFLMWLSVFPPENNPLLDDHLIYIGVLALLAMVHAGKRLGFGREWDHLAFVKRHPWAE